MKIQLGDNLVKETIEDMLPYSTIVDNGDYILMSNDRRIPVDDGYEVFYILATEIYYVSSDGSFHQVILKDRVVSTKLTLQEMESEQLMRINKRVLVNSDYVENIKVKLNMKFSLKVKDVWLDVNRTYYYAFKERIGL